MKKITTLAGMTAALFLLAAGDSFAQTPPEKVRPRGADFFAGERGERLAEFLNLAPEQRAKFDEIRQARRAEAKAFREEIRKLRPELGEAMRDPQADEKKLDGLIDKMSQVRAAHLKSRVRSRKAMEKILTPDQLAKFRRAGARLAMRRGSDRGDGPSRWQRPGRRPARSRAFGRFGDDWF